jgi:hypothetical protein
MKEYFCSNRLMDCSIEARTHVLDDGIHVLVIGGCRTHVGAVSYAFPGQPVETVQFPTHRDGAVSERWAKTLCERMNCPVVVNCGIHYDNVTKADIMEIVKATDALLEQTLALLT